MVDINNLNSFINGLRSQGYKSGYKVDELPKIKSVYDFLIANGLSSKNFLSKLDTLVLKKLPMSEKGNYTAGGYKESTNTITYYEDKDLTHELFHMASTSPSSGTSGITRPNLSKTSNDSKINRGLDEGITDMLATMVDSSVICAYPFEKMCAEFLRNLFGIQVFNGYLENKYSVFVNSFPQEFQDNVRSIVKKLDTYHELSFKAYYRKSTFADIDRLKITTSEIMSILKEMAEKMHISNDNLIEFFNDRISIDNYEAIRELIGYNEALNNLSSQTL